MATRTSNLELYKLDTTDNMAATRTYLNSNADILDDVPTNAIAKLAGWPVNSIKLTTDNVNPGTLIGGTWAAMTTPSATLFGETVYAWKRTA